MIKYFYNDWVIRVLCTIPIALYMSSIITIENCVILEISVILCLVFIWFISGDEEMEFLKNIFGIK